MDFYYSPISEHAKNMDIILNKIAIWSPHGGNGLTFRAVPKGQKYLTSDSPVYQYSDGTLTRYAKNYEVEGVKYCLFLRTKCQESSLVEIMLDYYASKITKKEALAANELATSGEFDYTVYYFHEKRALELKEKGGE